jgi:deoxyribodipyrimidine photo-lyase
LAFRDFYASVLHEWPRSAWHNWNPNFDAIEARRGTGRRGVVRGVEAGPHRLSDRRRRDAAVERERIHAQPGADDRRLLPGQGSAPAVAVGARWFFEQLVDADVASNQHGWQWCAGTGTDAAPYFRVFNPTAQGEKFDPSGDYVRRWVPELAEITGAEVHRPQGRPAGGISRTDRRSRSRTRRGTAAVRASELRRYARMTAEH